LERALILLKLYGLNRIEYGYYDVKSVHENHLQQQPDSSHLLDKIESSLSFAQSNRAISFEKRICQLIESLKEHLSSKSKLELNLSKESFSKMEINLNNEFEGKTLLHLCAESGLNELFDSLVGFRNVINNLETSIELGLIKNELKLLKLDHHGYTPLVFI
jgi:hypothetical protein